MSIKNNLENLRLIETVLKTLRSVWVSLIGETVADAWFQRNDKQTPFSSDKFFVRRVGNFNLYTRKEYMLPDMNKLMETKFYQDGRMEENFCLLPNCHSGYIEATHISTGYTIGFARCLIKIENGDYKKAISDYIDSKIAPRLDRHELKIKSGAYRHRKHASCKLAPTLSDIESPDS